jgi:hypothetical protein
MIGAFLPAAQFIHLGDFLMQDPDGPGISAID